MQEVPVFSTTGISGYTYGQEVEHAKTVQVAAGATQEVGFTLAAPQKPQ
jgi:hypothetical protein